MNRRRLPMAVLVLVVAACGGSPSTSQSGEVAVATHAPTPAATSTPTGTPRVRRSPAPTPVPTPIAIPPFDATFTSPTMGYTVSYPSAWTAFPAKVPWKEGEGDSWSNPNGDRVEGPNEGFRGGSQPLLPGKTYDQWLTAYLRDSPSCGEHERIPLGGSVATFSLNGCRGLGYLGGRIYDLVVDIDRRVYNFTTEGEIDRPYLDALLATLVFHPKAARD